MDIVALAYNLCDVDFLAIPSPPDGATVDDHSSMDLYRLFTADDNQRETPNPPSSEPKDLNCTTDVGNDSSSKPEINASEYQSSGVIPMIDLTSPKPTEKSSRDSAVEPISPPDSNASPKTGSTVTSPEQVSSSSLLHSPDSMCSRSSCAGDLSNASSLLLQSHKGSNDDSIIEFLLSQDLVEHHTQQSPRSTRTSLETCGKRKHPDDTDSTEVPQPSGPRDCFPELNFDEQSTQKLDTFFKSIPDIRNEYLGKPSECPCVSPYMLQSDWRELVARCPPCSPHVCRIPSCEPPPAKRHCSPPQHKPFTTMVSSQVSPPETRSNVRPISNALYNQFALRNPQFQQNCSQPVVRNPQIPTSQYKAVDSISQRPQFPQQNTISLKSQEQKQNALTTTQRLSVLSGVTHHVPSSTSMSTAAQERAEKLKGKPTDTYIALIARAILSSPNLTTSLPDIYEQIMVQQPFYRTSTLAWRNAVRHNLSINECFVKVGKADSGRGWKWTIHPSCVEQFRRGDFRRREARSKVQQVHKKIITPAPYHHSQRNY